MFNDSTLISRDLFWTQPEMTEQTGVKGKLKDALFTMVAEQDRNIKLLTGDVKAFSQYAKSKVCIKNICPFNDCIHPFNL